MAKVDTKKKASGEEWSLEAISKAIKTMSKTLSIIGDKEITELCTVRKLQTDIPTIDYLGGGGITEGAITIFAGNPSACKTTIAMQVIAKQIRVWKENGIHKIVLYFDTEHSWDPVYAKVLGIDQDYVVIKHTNVIEEAFAEADSLISMGFVGMLVIDSLDNMIARKVDDNAYSATMGGTAGSLAQHLPKLHSKIIEFKITTIIIKQARVKLDAYGSKGEVITFSGGKALRHACDSIYIFKRMSNRNMSYTPIQCKAEKTRSSRMGLTLDLPNGDAGIDTIRDLVNIAIANGFITVAGGGWTSWNGHREQGTDKFVELVRGDHELQVALWKEVYEEIVINAALVCSDSGEAMNTEFEEENE